MPRTGKELFVGWSGKFSRRESGVGTSSVLCAQFIALVNFWFLALERM